MDLGLQLPGAYNGYNAAAAMLAVSRLGFDPAVVAGALAAMPPAFGRGQVIEYRGRRVKLLLVKNPAGFNQAIRLLRDAPSPVAVLIASNDQVADGRDVSWLWDAAVEELAGTSHRFGTGGLRAADMQPVFATESQWTHRAFAPVMPTAGLCRVAESNYALSA